MQNLQQHLTSQPTLLFILIASVAFLIISIPHYSEQHKRYGSAFRHVGKIRKNLSLIAGLAVVGILLYGLTPYVEPPTDELAIVIGNTQNTPTPTLTRGIVEAIEGSMLRHKGESREEIASSIRIISAVKDPQVINLDASELKLREIGNNSSNAKRSAEINIKAIVSKVSALPPEDNGANYLEAILSARDNVKAGSKIIVIGSGLSDNGELNFSKTNILTNESARTQTIKLIKEKYGFDYLEGYSIDFYGLGDTVLPQAPLSNKQKGIVRDIYRSTVQGLGGDAEIRTKTLLGNAVNTNYVVGTTDTGCGDIGLIFDDDNFKFVGDKATFIDESAAKNSLITVKTLWDKYSDIIQSVQVDGYIAHYPGPDVLSQQRADAVKKVLTNLGVPNDKITATGKGFGPHQQDSQNRMVKITISRNNDQCNN